MGARQVALSECPDDHDGHLNRGCHEVAQELKTGCVDPVEVVQYDDQRSACRGQCEETCDSFEDQKSLGISVASSRWWVGREASREIR